MDRESPELIKQDMNETRQSLTEKVAALEHHVVGTLHDATSAVHETVCTVKTALKDTVGAVTDSVSTMSQGVKDTFDIRSHIRDRPWAAIAGAALSGIVTGYLTAPTGERQKTSSFSRSTANGNGVDATYAASRPAAPAQAGGILDDLMHTVRQELKTVTENAVMTLAATLKQSLTAGIQNLAAASFSPGCTADRTSGNGAEMPSRRDAFSNGHHAGSSYQAG